MVNDLNTLTLAAAKLLAFKAAEMASEMNVAGAVAVADAGGHIIYLERLEGTMPAAAELAIGKAVTSVLFQRPTLNLENLLQNERIAMLSAGNNLNSSYTPLKGGHPIYLNGKVIGALAVAGAITGENDERIAKDSVKWFEQNYLKG